MLEPIATYPSAGARGGPEAGEESFTRSILSHALGRVGSSETNPGAKQNIGQPRPGEEAGNPCFPAMLTRSLEVLTRALDARRETVAKDAVPDQRKPSERPVTHMPDPENQNPLTSPTPLSVAAALSTGTSPPATPDEPPAALRAASARDLLRLALQLLFVVVILLFVVGLVVYGYTAGAAIELIAAAGLVAVEVLRRLG